MDAYGSLVEAVISLVEAGMAAGGIDGTTDCGSVAADALLPLAG